MKEDTLVDNGLMLVEKCLRMSINLSESKCPPYYDELPCWDPTPQNTLAAQLCFKEFCGIPYNKTQNVSQLQCMNRTWYNWTNYMKCTESIPDMIPAKVANYIYLAGFTLSLAVSLLALFVFFYLKELRCLKNTIHANFMFSFVLLACGWISNYFLENWAYDIQQHQTSCLLLVIFMQYIYLTNYLWMFVEGLYLYMLVVKPFTVENIRLRVYTSIGWGSSAIFIAIWVVSRCIVSIELDSCHNEIVIAEGKKKNMCLWMHKHWVDWIYAAPSVGVMVVNLFFLNRVMWVLIRKLRSKNKQYWKATKALLVLLPLLGITHPLLGFLRDFLFFYQPGSMQWFPYAVDFITKLLGSTQGFAVAMLYCFLNNEVRQAITKHIKRQMANRDFGDCRL